MKLDLLEPNLPLSISITVDIRKDINRKDATLFAERLPESERVGLHRKICEIDRHRLPVLPPGK